MKCIVFGCNNRSTAGEFVGELCRPCYHMLTTGKIGPGKTFIHDLKEEKEQAEMAYESTSYEF